MYDSVDTKQASAVRAVGWLLLIHQIPPKPDYLRVKVRRRLHGVGAIALKNSVYVLPYTDDAIEDFQWLRRLVVDEGGEATLCAATFIEGVSDHELESMFRERADVEYDELIDAARKALVAPTDVDVRRLERQLAQASARDFFGAERADAAARAVREVEEAVERNRHTMTTPPDGEARAVRAGTTWVTRSGVFVDRIASAWLIRRFIDPKARFKFVPAKGYTPQRGELRFDMFEGEYTHEGESCTFEVFLARFAIDDSALRAIAEIVHDIDCKDETFGREETAGVASVLQGIALANDDDTARLDAGRALFDGLYASFRRSRV